MRSWVEADSWTEWILFSVWKQWLDSGFIHRCWSVISSGARPSWNGGNIVSYAKHSVTYLFGANEKNGVKSHPSLVFTSSDRLLHMSDMGQFGCGVTWHRSAHVASCFGESLVIQIIIVCNQSTIFSWLITLFIVLNFFQTKCIEMIIECSLLSNVSILSAHPVTPQNYSISRIFFLFWNR